MKNKLISAAIVLFLFFTTQAHSNPINKINFIGLNTSSESSLLEILPFEIGQDFSSISSDKIIKELFATGYFSDISITKDKNDLNIILKENPYVKYFLIDYIKPPFLSNWFKSEPEFLPQEALDNLVTNNNLSAGEIFNKSKLSEFILSLKNKFTEAGFYNVTIKETIETDKQNRTGISIEIIQGESATIGSLTISGANEFSQKDLLNLIPIGKPNIFFVNFFTKKDNYSDGDLDQGIKLLTEYYLNAGYLDFKITGVDSKLNDENTKISIDIQISEGAQYKLGVVTFSGELGAKTPSDLSKLLDINTGDVFNRQLVVNDIQKITDLYADQGYAFVDIKPITKDFLDSVNINIQISLNKKVYVNRIIISGNTRTQDEVIRREIGISEGALYSKSELRDSVVKLRRLGYFSKVEMDASEVENSPDKIDIRVAVSETQTGAVSFSVSHSNNYGISLGAGVKEKNIFGSGNTLNTELKLSESLNKLSFYFEDPNFNNENHSVSYGFFLSELNDDDVMNKSYEISEKGINIGYGIPLSDVTKLNTKLEYTKNKIKCGVDFSATGYEPTQCSSLINDELKISLKWNENTLNDYLHPTKGTNNSIGVNLALPVGDYRYIDLNASHTSYRPLGNELTFKLTGDFALATGYDSKELPFHKRYFAGGSGSIRGFGSKTLGPLYPNKSAKGGELSILGSANIIAPAYLFDDSGNMRISAFIDAGNIYEKTSNIKLEDIRMSAGFGFAYLSPIGAIGMYLSTPILKKTGDVIDNFGFTLGTGF
tara:strand:- start:1983 stop:4298 length:2316 start_codon:yes stop_codon:yes gene_type:complete